MKKSLKAIMAMSRNRAIGKNNQLPWPPIPEDFKWFKSLTLNNVIIMGRKTWDSIGKPLPKRESIVVSRSNLTIPGARVINSLDQLHPEDDNREYFIIGGAQIFKEALPRCSDVYLTLIKEDYEGDIFLPLFEDQFKIEAVISDTEKFSILHYTRS